MDTVKYLARNGKIDVLTGGDWKKVAVWSYYNYKGKSDRREYPAEIIFDTEQEAKLYLIEEQKLHIKRLQEAIELEQKNLLEMTEPSVGDLRRE